MTAAPDPRRTRTGRWLASSIALLALALAAPVAAASPDPSAAPATSPAPSASAPASPAPSASPAAEVSPDPDASPGPSAAPAIRMGTIPAEGGLLEPGEYLDWSLGPTLRFNVADGWAATPVDAGFGLALVWGGSQVPGVLTFTQFDGLVFQDPCLATTEETLPIDLTPDALAADLAQSPYLVVAEPVETQVAGLPALRLEIATQQPMGCEPPATWIWAAATGGGFVLEDGEQATLLLLTVGERVLVVAWEAYPGGDFEGLTAAAEAIVETLTIDASNDPGPGASLTPGAGASPIASEAPAA